MAIPDRLVRQAEAHSRARAFFTRHFVRRSMVNGLRVGFDSVYASSGPRVDVACGYIGGDTPHVWTPGEWASRPERYRLTIWVRDFAANGAADGAAAKAKAQSLGQPPGTCISWDAEQLVNPGYHAAFSAAAAPYVVPTYGAESTVFGNPPPYWIAAWNHSPTLERGHSHQYESTNAYDLSVFAPNLPLWDTQGPAPTPTPPQPVKRGKRMWLLSLPNGSVYVTDGVLFRWLNGPDEVGAVAWSIAKQGGNASIDKVATWQQIGVPADSRSASAAGAPWPAATQ